MFPAHFTTDSLPPLTWDEVWTTWVFEPLPAIAVALAAGLYMYGVGRLSARGVRWPVGRTLAFIGMGLGSIVVATQSFLAAYDTTLFWVHMAQHMLLTMWAPMFLALGAPVTLALRTLPKGGRSALLTVIHSRVARVLTFPLLAGAMFVINPWVLYFTPLYEATLSNEFLHNWNHLHFVVVGCLWFWVILGIDPLPGRPSHPMRLLAVFLTLPFHAFLGVAIMSSSEIIGGHWYEEVARTWGPTLAEDQRIAGSMLWAWGDVMAVVMMIILFVQWARAADREAVRVDRELDRQESMRASAALPDNMSESIEVARAERDSPLP